LLTVFFQSEEQADPKVEEVGEIIERRERLETRSRRSN